MKPSPQTDRDEVPEGGMSDYEIAEQMGITRTRVWQIRQRAMKKLKRLAETDPEFKLFFERNYA